MTTPHQTENGYENATDEEKTKMMLQIAKEANAEQKAMFEPEKQPCLCKDKGVIELIEEAVEAERARIQEQIQKEGVENDSVWGKGYNAGLFTSLMIVQVINKEEIPRNPLDQNKWM